MKLVNSLVVFSCSLFLLSACGSGGGSDNNSGGASGGGGGPVKPSATQSDGSCTPQVISDVKGLSSTSMDVMKSMTSDLKNHVDKQIDSAELERRTTANGQKLQDAVEKIRSTYGDFQCRYLQTDYSYGWLNSADVYKIGDQITAAKNAPVVASPIGKDGDCSDGFTADYNKLSDDTRAPLSDLMGGVSELMNNSYGDQTAIKAKLKRAGQTLVGVFEAFRAKYPGDYACNTTTEDGRKTVVSSSDFDNSLAKMREQMPR